MAFYWCGTCGMEDTIEHKACPTCGSALQRTDADFLTGGEASETAFELELEPIERAALVHALISNNIKHRWDDEQELVVADENADAVDLLLDEVLGEEEDFDDDDGEEDFDGEDDEEDEGYDTLSELFVATGRLLKKRDAERIADFCDAASSVLEASAPFGVEAETWADIQSTARNASVALAEDATVSIDADLKGLYNQLQLLV